LLVTLDKNSFLKLTFADMLDSKTSMLKEIIDSLVNIEESLVPALRKLHYFGLATRNTYLTEYVTNEINGYPKKGNNLPDYRKTLGTIEIDIMVGYAQMKTVEIPNGLLPNEIGTALQYVSITDGIGIIENHLKLIKAKDNGSLTPCTPLPLQSLIWLQPVAEKLYNAGMKIYAEKPRVSFNSSKYDEILNTVRTTLLDVTMKIVGEFGYNVKISSFSKIPEQKNNIINTYMQHIITTHGDANVINTGDKANVTATISVNKGDMDSLNNALSEKGVDQEDIKELNEIVTTEKPDPDKNILGQRAIEWIQKITGKALSGIGKIAVHVSSDLLAAYLKQYYGM
jgi:hypothetical protein